MLSTTKRARRNAKPLLRANVVLMRDTIDTFAALCRELADWGIDEITFNQLGGIDRPEFYPAHRLRPTQVEKLADDLSRLRAELLKHGVLLRGATDYLNRIAASSRDHKLTPADCAPGKRFLFIDEAGVIAPCSHTPREYGVPVTEIHSVEDLAALPARFAERRRAHQIGRAHV